MSYLIIFFDQMSYLAKCRIHQMSYATNCRIGEMVFDDLSCTRLMLVRSKCLRDQICFAPKLQISSTRTTPSPMSTASPTYIVWLHQADSTKFNNMSPGDDFGKKEFFRSVKKGFMSYFEILVSSKLLSFSNNYTSRGYE